MSISLRGVVLATPTKAVRRSRYACIESETASAAFAPFSFGRVLGRFLSFPVLVNFSMVFGNCVLQSDFGQGVVGRESVVRVLWFTRRSTKTAMAHGPSGLSSVRWSVDVVVHACGHFRDGPVSAAKSAGLEGDGSGRLGQTRRSPHEASRVCVSLMCLLCDRGFKCIL